MSTQIVCVRLKNETVADLKRRAHMDGYDMEEGLSRLIEELVKRFGQMT